MPRKPLLLAILAVVLVGGAVFYARTLRREARAARAAEAKKQVQAAREEPAEEEEKSPPPPPKPKVTELSTEGRAHLAEKAFVSGLRAAFLWRSGQAPSAQVSGEWLEKLAAIPSDDLPPEIRAAWQSLLEAWRALSSDPARANDPGTREKGQQAATVLNAMLKQHGDGDIQL